MITNENYQLSQGSSLDITAVIGDQSGNPVTGYAGTERLTTVVWPGDARPMSFTASTVWTDPMQGTISIAVTATETTGPAIGRYQLLTRVTSAGHGPVDGYGCTLDVLAAPGSDTAPSTYTTYDDLGLAQK
jgi:hypothetical protein